MATNVNSYEPMKYGYHGLRRQVRLKLYQENEPVTLNRHDYARQGRIVSRLDHKNIRILSIILCCQPVSTEHSLLVFLLAETLF